MPQATEEQLQKFLTNPEQGETALLVADEFDLPSGAKFRLAVTCEYVGKTAETPTGYVLHLGVGGVVTLTFELSEYRILREVLTRLAL